MYDTYYNKNGIVVRRSFPSDADNLCQRLRQTDIDEIWASHNLTPWDALNIGINESIISLTVTIKGLPCAVFGINAESALGKKATIWLLASDDLDKIKHRFLRHSKKFVGMFLNMYPHLSNYVDVRNIPSITWLLYCGAKMDRPSPYGVMRKDFRYFWFEK